MSSKQMQRNERVRSMAENIKSDDVRTCIAMPIFYLKRKDRKSLQAKKNCPASFVFFSFHLLPTLLVMWNVVSYKICKIFFFEGTLTRMPSPSSSTALLPLPPPIHRVGFQLASFDLNEVSSSSTFTTRFCVRAPTPKSHHYYQKKVRKWERGIICILSIPLASYVCV